MQGGAQAPRWPAGQALALARATLPGGLARCGRQCGLAGGRGAVQAPAGHANVHLRMQVRAQGPRLLCMKACLLLPNGAAAGDSGRQLSPGASKRCCRPLPRIADWPAWRPPAAAAAAASARPLAAPPAEGRGRQRGRGCSAWVAACLLCYGEQLSGCNSHRDNVLLGQSSAYRGLSWL